MARVAEVKGCTGPDPALTISPVIYSISAPFTLTIDSI